MCQRQLKLYLKLSVMEGCNLEDIVLIGFGGHAKSVADCIKRQGKYRIAGYTDMSIHETEYEYLGSDNQLEHIYMSGIKNAFVCIGYLGKGCLRENLYIQLKKIGFYLPIIADPSAIIAESATIGEGTFIGKNAVINSEAYIGRMAIINTMALIEHECVVGDFAHIAVAAVLCGQVEVGNAAFVGANATVIQNMVVNSNQIVPAGATIR